MFNLSVSTEELSILSEALGNMPFNKVVTFITKLQKQIDSQLIKTNQQEISKVDTETAS